ncbi:histone-lysine N-trimethyltransferase SMYD5 [Planococcus citri]|uniref:histone-lysine N-trimethyltransferase SMYD5 n=1 Tax=Planococcus citri TaxID=170843 RepID=UPI0031FA0E32
MDAVQELLNSPDIELKVLEDKGKCLFSTVHFKKGDTIFEEVPLISCQFAWNKTYKYLACDHCMRPLESVDENIARLTADQVVEVPFLEYNSTVKADHRKCPNCEELYCSEVCLANAYKQYHQFLCYRNSEDEPFFQLVERWKLMYYPPETTNIMLLARIIATIQLAENKEYAYNTFMQFCHLSLSNDETLVHNLLGEKFRNDIDELFSIFKIAMESRLNGESNSYVKNLLTREGFIRMLSLIGRNGQGIGTSVLAEWANKLLSLEVSPSEKATIDKLIDDIYEKVDQHVGNFISNEGSGLYVVQSCINHSCAANAKITFPFNNNRLALVAKREIMPGEEIFINYLDKCARKRSCHSRRKILKDHYLFICMCSKCVVDSTEEPDVTSEDESEDEEMD